MDSSEKKPIFKKWWFWVLAVIVLAIIGKAMGNKSTDSPAKVSNRITLAKYNMIQPGLSREEVEQIISGSKDGIVEGDMPLSVEQIRHMKENPTDNFVVTYKGESGSAEITYSTTADNSIQKVVSKTQTGLE
jgi:hypothetical protein